MQEDMVTIAEQPIRPLADRVNEYRKARGWGSIPALAREVGVTPNYVHQFRRGLRPSASVYERIDALLAAAGF